MRRVLELISLAALAALAWVTYGALAGPHPLKGRIPIHFDLAGRPNGWGSPHSLLILPVIADALYLLLVWVSRHPATFNYPVQVTAENRPRLEALAIHLIAWLKAEILCLLVWIQVTAIAAAHPGHARLSPSMAPVSIGIILGTVIAHIIAMRRLAPSA